MNYLSLDSLQLLTDLLGQVQLSAAMPPDELEQTAARVARARRELDLAKQELTALALTPPPD